MLQLVLSVPQIYVGMGALLPVTKKGNRTAKPPSRAMDGKEMGSWNVTFFDNAFGRVETRLVASELIGPSTDMKSSVP
jgi:hypothetical protein